MISWETLTSQGIAVPRFARVSSLSEAEAFVHDLEGAPVCLKAETSLHKSALGLVQLDLRSGRSLQAGWQRLVSRGGEVGIASPFLVQEMIPAGIELFAGVTQDVAFGPVLLAGIGGRMVELIGCRVLRLLPLADGEADAMVAELGLGALVSVEAKRNFTTVLEALSRIASTHPTLGELDLNPVIVGERAATVVDIRVVDSNPDPDRPATRVPTNPTAPQEGIRRLLSPSSVAVIGASADPSKPGGRVCSYLAEKAPNLPVYAVNPRGGEIFGFPVLGRVDDLPDGIDAAVVATPAATVSEVVRELGRKHVPAAVVFASGFKEAGSSDLEAQVASAAREVGVRLCGVNCMGVIGDAPLTFTQALSAKSVPGGVSFLTQSGAIGGSLLLGAWATELGTARFVSVGNETDLDVPDYLEFLAGDDATTTIGLFLEGVSDGRRLRDALSRVRRAGKPVVAIRTGASEVAAAAVRTHTGALAGSDEIYRQVLQETGVILVSDIPELLGICQALEWQPRAGGPRIGVLSTSGGGCSLVADELAKRGLEVPALEPDVQSQLREVLPSFAATRNPVDTTGNIAGDAALLGRIMAPVVASEQIDAVFVAISALVGSAARQLVESVVEIASATPKPIVVSWMVPEIALIDQFRYLRSNRIPVFDSIELACSAIRALTRTGLESRRVTGAQRHG